MRREVQLDVQVLVSEDGLFFTEQRVRKSRLEDRKSLWLVVAGLHHGDVHDIVGAACPWKDKNALLGASLWFKEMK